MSPRISIIIPLYNKAQHIKATLDSVWHQTFEYFEVILVNDGSTDDGLDIVKAIEEERLHIYTTENKGVSHARNFGIDKAKAELIAFLDADDLWYEHHLQDLIDLYEAFPDCGMYCKAYEKQNGNRTIKSYYKNIPKTLWQGIIDDYFASSLANSIAWTSAVMIPKSTFKTIGTFNVLYNSGEDTDLWIRIALNHPIAFSNKVSAIHLLDTQEKITNKPLNSRQFIDFDHYENDAKNNENLKVYLDLNRYALAIQHKLEGNSNQSKVLYKKIKQSSLTAFQKFIYKLPKPIIHATLQLRGFLRKFNLDLRLFR